MALIDEQDERRGVTSVVKEQDLEHPPPQDLVHVVLFQIFLSSDEAEALG